MASCSAMSTFSQPQIAFAGVALGVFVGQLAALGRHDGGRGVVLAGDQLDVGFLAVVFSLDRGEEFGIGLLDQGIAMEHDGSPYGGWSLSVVRQGCPGERLYAGGRRHASPW